ncbi:ABC transporter permease [Oscillospiraceae bacterium HV4-5-C5C]|nr:ABC transporter permease [Oscillospiraceae bacterium HV4-5-C5C]
MLLMGYDAAKAYQSLWQGIFGSRNAIAESLVQTTPLIFTAISYALTYKAGLINLGGEGQLYIGAVWGSVLGSRLSGIPVWLHWILIFAAAFAGGAIWGAISGLLKVRFKASELITTIMLNYIALEWVSFCVTNLPFKDQTAGAAPRMPTVVDNVKLSLLLPKTRLHSGFILALLVLLIYYLFMWKTTKGFELRVNGQNPNAALYAGMPVKHNAVLAFALAGGTAGLGGIINILGLQYFLTEGFASGLGFSGVAVALLGNSQPLGILLAAFLFGALNAGGIRMQTAAAVPSAMISMIQGIIIFFAVSPYLLSWIGTQLISGRNRHNLSLQNQLPPESAQLAMTTDRGKSDPEKSR